jgi:hypothetical protein
MKKGVKVFVLLVQAAYYRLTLFKLRIVRAKLPFQLRMKFLDFSLKRFRSDFLGRKLTLDSSERKKMLAKV